MLVIDRFEGAWAVIEDNRDTFVVPRRLLPKEAKEGDVVNITIEINSSATIERSNKMKQLLQFDR